MSWSQVSDHRWERPSNGTEGFLIFMENTSASLFEGRRQFTIFSRLKVNLQIPADELEDALRYAWKQVRSEQPQLAETVEGYNKIYEVPDEAALQSWLEKTFIVSDEMEGEAIANQSRPIDQVTFYYVPKASQLIIRAPHSTIDGIGILLLWHTYLTALANPKPNLAIGEEATRLCPSREKALGHADVPPAETVVKATKMVAEKAAFYPGIGPVNRIGTVPAGSTQRREVVYSERITDAIVQACKRNGYSVTAAVHAAWVLTIVKHADPTQTSETSKYLTFGQFNLRPYLPEPYSSSQYAVANYSIGWPLVFEKPNKFKEFVHIIDEAYKTTFKDNPENLEMSGSVINCLRNIVQSPEFMAGPVARDAIVSSLGIIERYLQQSYASADNSRQIIIEDLKFGIECILGDSMVSLYTFRDQLRMVFSFNESYEDESHVQGYLEEIQKILLEELVA
ncbi:hypothetical protein N7456_007276 [Penicillium angulare]|uniref:Condensation domain-containing protein n=1 Tax=Penicillium angulare TaxID=116970 RepID=A0A9W9FJF3_9EURO|nr:hypothetical protein N7456_007276 [Penicillium angulare]